MSRSSRPPKPTKLQPQIARSRLYQNETRKKNHFAFSRSTQISSSIHYYLSCRMVLRILLSSLHTVPEFNKLPLLSINISLTFLINSRTDKGSRKKVSTSPSQFYRIQFSGISQRPVDYRDSSTLLELSRDDNLKKMMALVRWYDAV